MRKGRGEGCWGEVRRRTRTHCERKVQDGSKVKRVRKKRSVRAPEDENTLKKGKGRKRLTLGPSAAETWSYLCGRAAYGVFSERRNWITYRDAGGTKNNRDNEPKTE